VPRYDEYWNEYYRLTERKGVSQQFAQIEMRRRLTLIGAMLVHMGDADGMLCGMLGTHESHRIYVNHVIGLRRGANVFAAMNAVIMGTRTVFIADTYVNVDPTAEQVAEIALLAADEIRRFGITPKIALLSHSNFGSSTHPQAKKMQAALALIDAADPDLEVEGEMHADAALSAEVREAMFPHSRLKGEANILIMPTCDAANIAFNLLKVTVGGGVTLGPMLLGVAKPVHILTPSATVRRIVNMTALTVVDCQLQRT
jgi:malate dehydrogenase (oxaloacetate-decarboxylating)(NADP+)